MRRTRKLCEQRSEGAAAGCKRRQGSAVLARACAALAVGACGAALAGGAAAAQAADADPARMASLAPAESDSTYDEGPADATEDSDPKYEGDSSLDVFAPADPESNPLVAIDPQAEESSPEGSSGTDSRNWCFGETDAVYRPRFRWVGGRSRTVCVNSRVTVATALYRQRWWGQQFLASSGGHAALHWAESSAEWYCGGTATTTYYAYGYHTVNGTQIRRSDRRLRFNC